MSIKAYVGRMGSGKTYEVVSVVILGALRRGRRVITNIAGLDYAACADLLVAEGCDPDKIGTIVTIPHERVTDADFWLTEAANEEHKSNWNECESSDNNVIHPGDLVCLDEIWRFWQGFAAKDADGKKRPESVMNFMRMHRHFTHPETGVACDLAIITQDVMDISRQVRAVIEETYRMEKLTAIGSTKRYRVDVCQGGQSRRVMRQLQRSYEEKYFGLYKSHSGRKEGEAGPKEENIDGRGNILSGWFFKLAIPGFVLVAGFGVWTVWGFFHPETGQPQAGAAAPASDVQAVADKSKPRRLDVPEESPEWRAIGWWQEGGRLRVVLENGVRSRVVEPPAWKMIGNHVETFLPSGEVVTSWTGARRAGMVEAASGMK